MAPLSTNAITHFMHPAHKLNYLTTNTSYLCDGCKVPGTGSRFTCTICSFDLHDYCTKCPTRLTSTTNHQHPMSLVVREPKPDQTESCQICHNPIKGLAYQCKDCNFWVHPLCVSGNSGQSQAGSVPSGSAAAAPRAQSQAGVAPSAAQRMGEQLGLGLATNYIYDQMKGEENPVGSNGSGAGEVPSAGSAEVPSAGSGTFDVEEDGGGFFGGIKSGLLSIFESSSS